MHKKHIALAGLAFLMCVISIYFGIRIYNANENTLISNLNEADNIFYDDVELVPTLSFLAALFTLPFILAILVLEIISIFKTGKRQVKNMAIGLTCVICIILIIDIFTLVNPIDFDFSNWGYVWICLGLVLFAGNVLSFAIYRLSAPPKELED